MASNNISSIYLEDRGEYIDNFNSCLYCKLSDSKYLVQCSECNYSFCNGQCDGNNTNSHIVNHLLFSKHTQINYENQKISCDYCYESNVFNLLINEKFSSQNGSIKFICQNHYERKKIRDISFQ